MCLDCSKTWESTEEGTDKDPCVQGAQIPETRKLRPGEPLCVAPGGPPQCPIQCQDLSWGAGSSLYLQLQHWAWRCPGGKGAPEARVLVLPCL